MGLAGLVASVALLAALPAAPASASPADCLAYLEDQGFTPDTAGASSYAIAEMGCQNGVSPIICNSLIVLATDDFNEAHPPGVQSSIACWWAGW